MSSKYTHCVRVVSNHQITYGTGRANTRPHREGGWGTLEFRIHRTWNLSLVNYKGNVSVFLKYSSKREEKKVSIVFFPFVRKLLSF